MPPAPCSRPPRSFRSSRKIFRRSCRPAPGCPGGGGAHGEADRPAGAEVEVAVVEGGGVCRAEEILRGQRAVGLLRQPDDRFGELTGRRIPGSRRRGDAVARGGEDPAGTVRHQPATTLPDAGLVVGHAGLVGPQRALPLAGHFHAGHESGPRRDVAVRGERRVNPPVQQQQARTLAFVPGVEGEAGIVGRMAEDAAVQRDRAGLDVDPEQVPGEGFRLEQGHHVDRAGRTVIHRSRGDPDVRRQVRSSHRSARALPARSTT